MVKDIHIARVQLESALKIAQTFLISPLASLDGAGQLEDSRIIRQRPACYIELSKSAAIIESAAIQIFAARKVRFACVGAQTECCLHSSLCQRQARGSVINAHKIELVVGISQLAISKKKRRVARNRLIEEVDRLQEFLIEASAHGG